MAMRMLWTVPPQIFERGGARIAARWQLDLRRPGPSVSSASYLLAQAPLVELAGSRGDELEGGSASERHSHQQPHGATHSPLLPELIHHVPRGRLKPLSGGASGLYLPCALEEAPEAEALQPGPPVQVVSTVWFSILPLVLVEGDLLEDTFSHDGVKAQCCCRQGVVIGDDFLLLLVVGCLNEVTMTVLLYCVYLLGDEVGLEEGQHLVRIVAATGPAHV